MANAAAAAAAVTRGGQGGGAPYSTSSARVVSGGLGEADIPPPPQAEQGGLWEFEEVRWAMVWGDASAWSCMCVSPAHGHVLSTSTHRPQVDMDAIDLENLEKDDDEDEEEEDFNPDEDVVIVEEDDFVVRACGRAFVSLAGWAGLALVRSVRSFLMEGGTDGSIALFVSQHTHVQIVSEDDHFDEFVDDEEEEDRLVVDDAEQEEEDEVEEFDDVHASLLGW